MKEEIRNWFNWYHEGYISEVDCFDEVCALLCDAKLNKLFSEFKFADAIEDFETCRKLEAKMFDIVETHMRSL